MNEFAQEPWRIEAETRPALDGSADDFTEYVVFSGSEELARVYDSENARLTAAAPELYEALYDLLAYAQEMDEFSDPAGAPDMGDAAKKIAEDAIARAEGREPR